MPAKARLSAKFQISIPKEVRDAQAWRAGQEFVFIPKGAGVMLMPVPELDDIIGLARGVKDRTFRDRKDRM
jgi:AbrB family looped-hinge helix DNA binding protein